MGLFRSVERFGVIRFQDQQWTNGERGIRTLGTDDPYYGLAIRRFGPLSHLSKMECNKMNGGVRMYTIACMYCRYNPYMLRIVSTIYAMNIALIQTDEGLRTSEKVHTYVRKSSYVCQDSNLRTDQSIYFYLVSKPRY